MKRLILGIAGLVALAFQAHADDGRTVYQARVTDPGDQTNKHYDLCDGKSASHAKNMELARTLGLKRFPGPAYNRLAHGMVADTITDGLIIGLEKGYRKAIGAPEGVHLHYLKTFSEVSPDGSKAVVTRDQLLKSAFGDPKPLYVSHIFDYADRSSCAWHSVYPDSKMCAGRQPGSANAFHGGIDAMEDVFRNRVRPALASGRFTHVMFMAMGWHNDQQVSICRYDAISEAIKRASAASGRTFRPYIIGVTWPSAWFASNPIDLINKIGHIGSYINKADDADEAGYLFGNMIANRLVPEANSRGLPFVAIGHSFGTRLVNRSVFSRDLLRSGATGEGPDLAVALQAAHSIYRFLPGRGVEGYPFAATDTMRPRLVATSSTRDTANPVAIWSQFVGGAGGVRVAANPDNRQWLDFNARDKSLGPSGSVSRALETLELKPGKPLIVDASGFVFEHNDIMSDDMGRFLAALIERYASARR